MKTKKELIFIIILLVLLCFTMFLLNITSKKIRSLKEQNWEQLDNYNKCIEILNEAHDQLDNRKVLINQLRSAICYYNGVGIGTWWKDVSVPCSEWWMHRSWYYNKRDNCDSSLWLNCEINIKP